MKKFAAIAAALFTIGLTNAPAKASSIFSFALSGANESPAVVTPASGSGTILLLDDLTTLTISLNFSGLSGPAAAGHIHCCIAPGGNAPVVLPFSSLPATTSGTYTRTFDLNASGVLTGITASALVAGLQSGNAYVNLHTALNPGGEIRGFVVATPEPATWSLLALSLAAGLGTRSLRRRSA